jgi:hypothetical protein
MINHPPALAGASVLDLMTFVRAVSPAEGQQHINDPDNG